MSILSNLLDHLRSWHPGPATYMPPADCVLPEPPQPPVKLKAPKPWPDPPDVSCFVKGIAKSLREDPEEMWVTVSTLIYHGWDTGIKHADLDVTIWMRYRWKQGLGTSQPSLPGCTWLKGVYIPSTDKPHELALIAQALEAHPRGWLKSYIEEEQKAAVLAKRTTDHFTKLGCPDQA